MPSTTMKISELGRKADVNPKTIRYYEQRGLLPEPKRLGNGYRVYDEADLRRLQFIRGAQAAGLTLDGVFELLDVVDSGDAPCRLTKSLARRRIEEIDRQIEALASLRDRLAALAALEDVDRDAPVDLMCPLIGV